MRPYRTSEELQHLILKSLRVCPLDQFQVAASVAEPPFRVRAELKALKRKRLVFEQLGSSRILWRMTEAGTAIAWGDEQMEMVR